MKQGRTFAGLLLLAGLGFALLGQFYFAYRREYVWDGVLFWCVAVVLFALLGRRMTRAERRRPGWALSPWISRHPWRVLAVTGGAWFSISAGWQARRRPEMADFSDLLWLWLIGVAWFLLAFVSPASVEEAGLRLARWARGLRRAFGARLRQAPGPEPGAKARSGHVQSNARSSRQRRVERAALAALLLVALAARAVDLEHIPANLGGDEGTQGVAALELVGPPLGNPFSTGWFSVPTMSFLAWGLSMRVFGESMAGLRALSALVGALTVLTTFLLVRELWGRRVAWLAAAALSCAHFHIHFSRLGSNQVADGLFVTLALYLLVRALRSRQPMTFALAGAVMGLGWYGYFGARLVGIVAASYLAWRAIVAHRFLARYGRLLLVLLGAALVVTAPLLLHYVDHPENLASRFRQVSIFASGWLVREQEITGRSGASLLLQQLWKSVSAFHHTLDPTYWYHSSIPLLDFVSGVLFIPGILWATARCRWPANGLLLMWFWLALVLGWVVTENPPSSMRLMIVAPALAILVGLGLDWLIESGRRVFGGGRRSWDGVAAMALVVVAVLNLHYYFVVYTPTRICGNPTAEVATELSRYLAQRDDGYVVYFHAPPVMYWSLGTLDFMARGVEGVDVFPPGEGGPPQPDTDGRLESLPHDGDGRLESLPHDGDGRLESLPHVPDLSRGARFVFLPERLGELEAVRARVPGGVEMPVYSSADGRLLYVLYEVAPQ